MPISLLLVLGVIAAIVYIFLKARAGTRENNEKPYDSERQGFVRDVFESENYPDKYKSNEDFEDNKLIGDPYDDLEKLAALHHKGILTKEEFESKKKDILERI